MRPPSKTLTDQELEIMKIVWERHAATVRDVYEALLERRRVAYTTVMTMMKILEQKGYLNRKQVERAYVYRPAQPKSRVIRAMVRDFVNRVFNGSAEPLLVHLIEDRHLTADEIEEIRRLIGSRREAWQRGPSNCACRESGWRTGKRCWQSACYFRPWNRGAAPRTRTSSSPWGQPGRSRRTALRHISCLGARLCSSCWPPVAPRGRCGSPWGSANCAAGGAMRGCSRRFRRASISSARRLRRTPSSSCRLRYRVR